MAQRVQSSHHPPKNRNTTGVAKKKTLRIRISSIEAFWAVAFSGLPTEGPENDGTFEPEDCEHPPKAGGFAFEVFDAIRMAKIKRRCSCGDFWQQLVE